MIVTITCDHRHIYGADAAEFLKDLAGCCCCYYYYYYYYYYDHIVSIILIIIIIK